MYVLTRKSASTLLIATIFIIPCALSQNIATLLVCRAIDGIAFSAPMTLVGGSLADLWKNEERGVPMAAFSAAPFLGPASTSAPFSKFNLTAPLFASMQKRKRKKKTLY